MLSRFSLLSPSLGSPFSLMSRVLGRFLRVQAASSFRPVQTPWSSLVTADLRPWVSWAPVAFSEEIYTAWDQTLVGQAWNGAWGQLHWNIRPVSGSQVGPQRKLGCCYQKKAKWMLGRKHRQNLLYDDYRYLKKIYLLGKSMAGNKAQKRFWLL